MQTPRTMNKETSEIINKKQERYIGKIERDNSEIIRTRFFYFYFYFILYIRCNYL